MCFTQLSHIFFGSFAVNCGILLFIIVFWLHLIEILWFSHVSKLFYCVSESEILAAKLLQGKFYLLEPSAEPHHLSTLRVPCSLFFTLESSRFELEESCRLAVNLYIEYLLVSSMNQMGKDQNKCKL